MGNRPGGRPPSRLSSEPLLPALRDRQGLSLAGLGSLARYDRSYQPTQE